MSSKIYTKTGDAGFTSLIGGTKVSKSHLRIACYGTVDELNSYIGLINDMHTAPAIKTVLKEIQDRLFTIGSSLACAPDKEIKMQIPNLKKLDIEFLEKEIDFMSNSLSPMKHFILPGGHPLISHTHIARCVCRRAERTCVSVKEQGEEIEPLILQYMNRLSDYLFVLARYTAYILQIPDVVWKPRID